MLTGTVNLFVDNVRGVTWNKDAFKRLVMPPSTKDLVEALIKAHASASWQQGGLVSGKRLDLIAGKGLGLIMLLHGSPGTGKTLTAGKLLPPYTNQHILTDIRKVCDSLMCHDDKFTNLFVVSQK